MTDPTAAAAPTDAGNTPSTAPATASAPATSAGDSSAAASAVVDGSAPTAAEAPTAPTPKAPAAYDFKAAQGKVDPAVLSKFESLARELDLTQDSASKLIDQLTPEMAKAQGAKLDAAKVGWLEASKVDKEFGGEKLQENMAIAKQALDSFGSPELAKLLDESGLGNHPEIIRAFYRAGLKITSGKFVPSGQGAPTQTTAASKLYPSMNKGA